MGLGLGQFSSRPTHTGEVRQKAGDLSGRLPFKLHPAKFRRRKPPGRPPGVSASPERPRGSAQLVFHRLGGGPRRRKARARASAPRRNVLLFDQHRSIGLKSGTWRRVMTVLTAVSESVAPIVRRGADPHVGQRRGVRTPRPHRRGTGCRLLLRATARELGARRQREHRRTRAAYFPKWHDCATITQAQVGQVGERLNERPRKTLGHRTPNEVFYRRRPVALQS